MKICPFCSEKLRSSVSTCTKCGAALEQARYIYRMHQIAPRLILEAGEQEQGKELSSYLEKVVNEWAKRGWEFQRVDSMTVEIPAGCLGALLGMPSSLKSYHVATFRKPYDEKATT